jgi:Cu-processing system ATP-binding protein
VRGLVRHFGAVRAVDGVDLDVQPGEVFGLIGHNGAGKSTLFRMMLGLLRPGAGDVLVQGAQPAGRGFRAVRRSVGYLPENVVLYDNLSGLETLRFFARLKSAPVAECGPLLERVGLAHAADRPVRDYSKGMRQRLGFAQALLGRPRVLFLDEPTTGLDPEAIRAFHASLSELRAQGVTVLLSSHILAELQEQVDRLAILASGRVRALGSVQELRESLDLPLRLEVRTTPGAAGAVRQALAGLPLQGWDCGEARLSAQLPRGAKMPAIAAIAALGASVLDLKVHEPSLEDVFFGCAA